MRILRFIIGVILIPVGVIFTIAIVNTFGLFTDFSRTEIVFLSGFLAYLILHFLLYRPVFMHVMAHEFTHAIWALIFGGKVKSLNISSSGGSVTIDKTNFLVILAPYFFPFYTIIAVLLSLIIERQYLDFAVFFIGFTLSFHLALTIFSMKTKQDDFKQVGLLFSLSFIYLVNVIVIAGIFSLVSKQFQFMQFLDESYKITKQVIGL